MFIYSFLIIEKLFSFENNYTPMTIGNILKTTPSILKGIYLLWVLINLYLLLTNFNPIKRGRDYDDKFYYYFDHSYIYTVGISFETEQNSDGGYEDFYYKTKVFFPFTSPVVLDMKFVEFYDMTEFIFYCIAPIILYLIFKLIFSKEKSKIT